MARPSKYPPAFAEQATKLCRSGATDAELADLFEVSERTLNTWKTWHSAFLRAIRAGKVLADAEVTNSLSHRALGYKHAAEDLRVCKGVIVTTPITKHYPPDTVSCIF